AASRPAPSPVGGRAGADPAPLCSGTRTSPTSGPQPRPRVMSPGGPGGGSAGAAVPAEVSGPQGVRGAIPQDGAVRLDLGGDSGEGLAGRKGVQAAPVAQPDRDPVVGGLRGADDGLVGDQPGVPDPGAEAAPVRSGGLGPQPQAGAAPDERLGLRQLLLGD